MIDRLELKTIRNSCGQGQSFVIKYYGAPANAACVIFISLSGNNSSAGYDVNFISEITSSVGASGNGTLHRPEHGVGIHSGKLEISMKHISNSKLTSCWEVQNGR